MPIEFTKEQEKAVNAKGNILVSAAAGSGKTAVLVERVIRRLTDKVNPVSADRLLIVTFTNAAAAEMRTRIEKRLDDECRANPDDVGLRRQKQLLSTAKICTVDSFCIDLVRQNFEKAGVSPDFKISDEASLDTVNDAVLRSFISELFEKKDPVFNELLDLVGAEYDDGDFSNLIMSLFKYSRQLPFPEKWFKQLSGMYNGGVFNSSSEWYKYAFSVLNKTLPCIKTNISNAIDSVSGDEANVKLYEYCRIAENLCGGLEAAAATNEWDTVFNCLLDFVLPGKPRKTKDISDSSNSAVTALKELTEKDIKSLRELFFDDFASINEQFKKIYKPMGLLTEILLDFDKKLFDEYRRRNIFTFHNAEHLALNLLCSDSENGIETNPDAAELLNSYDEVMVDEYQDTNDLQDMLFHILSGKGKKLFAVGDVKQSIYGFRGANPSNFLKKKQDALPYGEGENGAPHKIILGNNFRSKAEICGFINFFFKNFMTKNTGEIVYDGEEELIPAAEYPAVSDMPVTVDIINTTGGEDKALIYEARRIADYIKNVMSSGKCIRKDKETLRRAKYSDFTVLLRSVKNKMPVIAEELRKQGIPVNFTPENFAESQEIAVILSLLKVIDNPDSDVELLTVMMSPIFAFTAEEAANIRLIKRKDSIYSAVVFAAENGNGHCKELLERLAKYRMLSAVSPLNRLLTFLLTDTDYLNTVSAMADGGRRRNNLLLLCDYAKQYSADNNVSDTGGFVRYILRQSENGIKSAASLSGGDSVKIMSIHSSKGLQFPVCIIAGTALKFNSSEKRENSQFSVQYGLGMRYFDEHTKEKRTTVSRQVIIADKFNREREEELRLLYVAMTRAQDRLHITGSIGNIDKELPKYADMLLLNGRTDAVFRHTNSYFEWLMYVLLLHPDGAVLRGAGSNIIPLETESRVKINIADANDSTAVCEKTDGDVYIPEKETVNAVKESISYSYPYAPLTEIEAKSSVSAIANKAESAKYAFSSKPSFMSDGGITAAERGTAMHRVMQFIDFNGTDNLEEEIDRLYEWQFISEREARAVSRKALEIFFKSDVFRRIKKSRLVKREMRFLTELPAGKIDPNIDERFKDEGIIVQGAVDLCFVEDGAVVVLDFKTDRADNPVALSDAYGEQLSIYAKACEKIFGLPVKQKLIYSFALSREIEIP